jgi:hypothetical protein
MLRLKQAFGIGICVLTTALLPTVSVHAATYYVSTSGSNSNSGTSSSPWRTVAYAASKMVAGDTTYVRGGTYYEGTIRFGKSGTSSAPIKLLNVSGQYPIISLSSSSQVLIQNSADYRKAIGWITIEGFEIRNGYNNIKIYNGNDLTIRRNYIHNSHHQGILGNGTRILIDRNTINRNGTCGSTCNQEHGLYMNGTAIKVTNNKFYNNLGYGVQMNGTVSYSSNNPGPEYAYSRNWVIANNIFSYQANRAGMVVWGSSCDNTLIENNTFYENGQNIASYHAQAIEFTGTGMSGLTIRYNLAYASAPGALLFLGSGATGYTSTGNTVNTVKPSLTTQLSAPTSLQSL